MKASPLFLHTNLPPPHNNNKNARREGHVHGLWLLRSLRSIISVCCHSHVDVTMSTTCDSLQDAEHPALVVTGPPDGGYSWVCVAACFTINCFSWGVVASYGVFLGYYLENGIYPAATTTDFAFIGGLYFSVAMPTSLAVTVLVRRNPFGIHCPCSSVYVFKQLALLQHCLQPAFGIFTLPKAS